MGEVEVPANRYWGTQTQRSYQNSQVGTEKMPKEIVRVPGILKKAAALVNHRLGEPDDEGLGLTSQACDEVVAGKLDRYLLPVVWWMDSDAQSDMNVNKVVADRGDEPAGKKLLHSGDHVNMSQSSSDIFPTTMHTAAAAVLGDKLSSATDGLVEAFRRLEGEDGGATRNGRTYLQDAVSITLAQEVSDWWISLEKDRAMAELTLPGLRELTLGGTAAGTGLDTPKGSDMTMAEAVSELTGRAFVTAPNKFHTLTSKNELVFVHEALKALTTNLMKIANDMRWLVSGPRCDLGEIHVLENESGSSIMPGKVNPTQYEVVTMVAVQVMDNDVAVGLAVFQGNSKLNVFMSTYIYNLLQSTRLLIGYTRSLNDHCAVDITVNREKCHHNLHNSLVLVAVLNSYIGYDNAAKIAKKTHIEYISLKEAHVSLGSLTARRFDEVFHLEEMV